MRAILDHYAPLTYCNINNTALKTVAVVHANFDAYHSSHSPEVVGMKVGFRG